MALRLVSAIVVTAFLLANPGSGVAEPQPNPDKFYMMTLEELLSVKVSVASRVSERLTDAPGVITVVSRDELERFGGTTLKDILERVPGFISSTAFFTDRTTIAVRGDMIKTTSSHVLVLINGRPVRESMEGGVSTDIFETFPINIIARIEVIRGPGSVLYGTDAFSAVINIVTERAVDTGGAVAVFGGPSGAFGATAEAKRRHGDLSVVAAARHLQVPDWDTTWSFFNIETGEAGSLDLTIPNQGGSAFLDLSYKGLRATFLYDQYETSYFLSLFGAHGNGKWKKTYGNLGYDFKISDSWDSELNITYARNQLDARRAYPQIERDSFDLLAEWTNSITVGDKTRLLMGASYDSVAGNERYTGVSPAITISDDTRYIAALYGQLDIHLTDTLAVIGGVQVNKVENIDIDLVPRAGVIWSPSANVNVKALYSQAFRAPSINEFGVNHPTHRGNPNLNPEKIATMDLSVSLYGERGQLTAGLFHSTLTDNIFAVYEGPIGEYQNLGEIRFQGIEIEGKYSVSRAVLLTGSVLYQENDDENGVEDLAPIAHLGAKAGISYRSDSGVTLSLFNIYQGDLDERYDGVYNPGPDAYNKLNLYARCRLNDLIGMDLKPDLSLFLQVDNALDEEIWLPEWGLTADTMPVNQGRTVYLGFEASF